MLKGFGTIIFTIRFGGPPLFLETPNWFEYFFNDYVMLFVCVTSLEYLFTIISWLKFKVY